MMNDRAYAKLFSGIVTSSMWSEDLATRVVWITLLACKNEHGEVHATVSALARLANVTPEQASAAIEKCLAPDADSRTPDNEGRRLEAIQGGWRILNNELYKRMASDAERKEYQARKYGERKAREVNGSTLVNNLQQPSTLSRQSESEEKVETKNKEAQTAKAQPAQVVFPDSLSNLAGFSAAWDEWLAYKKERRQKMGPVSIRRQLATLAKTPHNAIAMLHQSIQNNWQGLFELKTATPVKQVETVRYQGKTLQTDTPEGRFAKQMLVNAGQWPQ